jgi:hypothetical protein
LHTQNNRILKIYVIYKAFHHVYHSERIVDLDELELRDEAWLATVLRRLSDSSSENRIRTNVVYFIRSAISYLKSDPEGWEICRIREQDLTPKNLYTLFRILENLLPETDHTPESMRQISSKFRHAVLKTKLISTEEISVDSVKFKSSLGKLRHALQPILNMEDHLRVLEGESPLGAVPHKSYLDLIDKSANILQADLYKIIDACNQDLADAKKIRLRVKDLTSEGLINFQEIEIVSTLFKYPSSGTSKILSRYSAENILAVYRKGVLQHPQPMIRNGTFKLHGLSKNFAEIGLVKRKGYNCRQTFFHLNA